MRKRLYWYLGSALAIACVCSCNPFAPTSVQTSSTAQFGDPHTISGYFQAFQYAYQFRDTTLYGTLLAPNFIFSFHDYEQGVDIQWGRDDEMRATAGLFQPQNTVAITLLWGDILDAEGSPLDSTVTREFSLDVTFNEADIEHVAGSAVFHLQRSSLTDPWLAISWQDESNS